MKGGGSLKGPYKVPVADGVVGGILFQIRWNDGESSTATIYYTSEYGSTNPLSKTFYNFWDQERREAVIP